MNFGRPCTQCRASGLDLSLPEATVVDAQQAIARKILNERYQDVSPIDRAGLQIPTS
jgi:hypothetical protein